MTEKSKGNNARSARNVRTWIYDALLVIILIVGAYFRLIGVNWDEGQGLHPDERFLAFVESSIDFKKCEGQDLTVDYCPEDEKVWISISDYFNTATSPLNPHNRGYGFFVYGTWPIFFTRLIGEGMEQFGMGEVYQVGRPLSALADLGTVFLVYLIASRLYNKRVGLLAAAFSAFTVLQIQLSHFFKEDTFMTFFTVMAIYFAVRVLTKDPGWLITGVSINQAEEEVEGGAEISTAIPENLAMRVDRVKAFMRNSADFIFFGVALGMAVASKVNAVPVALILPAAVAIAVSKLPVNDRARSIVRAIGYVVLGAFISLLTFRILQPYAFSGPGFFGLMPNELWLDNLRSLMSQASADSIYGFPPSLQWAERPIVLFAWVNMVLWGFGAPLGILAWAGFIWMAVRMAKGQWRTHLLPWGWAAIYFVWQSSVFNPTMRYQLPAYPPLVIFAAWAVFELYDMKEIAIPRLQSLKRWVRPISVLLGGGVLIATLAWAFAFSRIYTRPVTRIEASRWIFQNVPGPINVSMVLDEGRYTQPISFSYDLQIVPGRPYQAGFVAKMDAAVDQLSFANIILLEFEDEYPALRVTLSRYPEGQEPLAVAVFTPEFQGADLESGVQVIDLPDSVPILEGETYYIQLAIRGETGVMTLKGSAPALQGPWDDPLPLRMDGFDGYGGIYERELHFHAYTPDNEEKLDRYLSILDEADYFFITSSRQWASTTRLPDYYPMTTEYFSRLMGCPDGRTVEWCYNVAQVGDYQGDLGFELIATFESDPNIGSFRINDQFSEEAFTVYDHPKVFIFQKTADYDSEFVHNVLSAVGFRREEGVAEGGEPVAPTDLLLTPERLVTQREGGTWSELFNTDSPINSFQPLGLIVWYLAVSILGWLALPLLRLALSGLPDQGYPFIRIGGMLVLSYLVWIAASLGLTFSRLIIALALVIIAVPAIVIAIRDRADIQKFLNDRRRYILIVEGLTLAFFVLFVLIRLGNPDLWHPHKGGEKPMDFSYFNAVLKSSTFPPYDPWFSGGYINYYYYGFVLVGVLVKFLGIVPSFAYNLILPTLFSMIAMGAFSIAWNLYTHSSRNLNGDEGKATGIPKWLIGLSAALGVAVLGNLGTVQMIYEGFKRLGATADASANIISRFISALRGFAQAITGTPLPYGLGDWYWNPSRIIPQLNDTLPITEFPFFTALYADPHAHLFALPITLLAIGWAISLVLGKGWEGKRNIKHILPTFLLGGLAIGVLRPTNTWDWPTYLAFGVVAMVYAVWMNYRPRAEGLWGIVPGSAQRIIVVLLSIVVLIGLTVALFQPYAYWYALGYDRPEAWHGDTTPIKAYLAHWGVFLFAIVSWMVWETRDWMSRTPISALRKYKPHINLIIFILVFIFAWLFILQALGVHIGWVVLPLGIWTAILLMRPNIAPAKQVVLFMFGTGLFLTLMVEVIRLEGDIARMNTVFKFYLQVWTLFAVSAAAAIGWIFKALPSWSLRSQRGWQAVLGVLVACAALFPILGGAAKIRDRMSADAPFTLDGMTYMQYATYWDFDVEMDLKQDYDAIRWLQENVSGSPVIVETSMVEYHWGTRYTIYTGLPSVVGWSWHQRQQRGVVTSIWVEDRVAEVAEFYLTEDLKTAVDFLDRYDVSYIILGQLERAKHPGPGLDKFEDHEGSHWREVFRTGETVIYEVLE